MTARRGCPTLSPVAVGKRRRGKRAAARPSDAGRASKKRPRPSSAPLSARERDEARALLAAATELVAGLADELSDDGLDPEQRACLRADLGSLAEFVERANGGRLFERNRRWSLLYELTKDARARKERVTPDGVARWRLLPAAYASASRDAAAARELLARSVAAPSRREWLELLVDAIAEVEADEMGDHKWYPEAFEATVLAHRRDERRVLR